MSKKLTVLLFMILGVFLVSVFYLKVFVYKDLPQNQTFLLQKIQKQTGTSFIVFGDSGNGSSEQKELAQLMLNYDFDLMLHTGDIAYPSGAKDQLTRNFFEIYSQHLKKAPFYPSAGNHDYMTSDLGPYLDSFILPEQALNPKDNERYYSFNVNNIHFIALDTNEPLSKISLLRGDDMADWLEEDLKKSAVREWKIVFFHHPPYSSGKVHGGDRLVRDLLVPIFEKYAVDIVFSGHEHNYERTCKLSGGNCFDRGITYVVTGGGGAGIYPFGQEQPFSLIRKSEYHFVHVSIETCKLNARVISINGEEIDQFNLEKC